MNSDIINRKLKDLYSDYYKNLTAKISKLNSSTIAVERATNPLLIKIDDKYVNSQLRIMVFGQETNYWHKAMNNGEFHGEIDPVIELYDNFFLKEVCFVKGGQFWNGINRLRKLLTQEVSGDIGIVWNNVLKVGKCGKGKPNLQIQETQFEAFNVTKREIEILAPDFLVFFSGPNYDTHLDNLFQVKCRTNVGSFTLRQLCKISFSDNTEGIRTYHPNYLWRHNINEFLIPIVGQIKMLHNKRYK